ncbi:MAG: hypothetical protein ABS75_32540 [Pelagibacterium sp. SCN 63-23]|nr:MAG: hypothetical protein ABS75_32540 [Pelagibacterium sp. SCN 63-23]
MYNTDFPDRADLPSSQKLVFSTIVAGVVALVLLVTIVLPSEYGFDLTGIGRPLGLTRMGEIKMQLAEEAAANERLSEQVAAGTVPTAVTQPVVSVPSAELAALAARVAALEQVIAPAQELATLPPIAVPPEPVAVQPATIPTEQVVATIPTGPQWRDEVSFTLTPMEGTEYKLVMDAGAVAEYEILVNGGVINFDAHGEGGGQSVTYEQVRGVPGDSGQLQAPFAGTHGWFFRNRGDADVVVTLRTGGNYSELRKLI